MLSSFILLTCLGQLAGQAPAAPSALQLPKPHFHQQPGDPPWLVQAVQFHGHLGPWVVTGTRLGMAGLSAVGAHGFFDVEVTCEGPLAKPPRSCFLDGLQVGTGATWGKRKLNWVPAGAVRVRIKNTETGKTAELCPTPQLLELLGAIKQPLKTNVEQQKHAEHDHQAPSTVESLARKIAAMSEAELFVVRVVAGP